MLGCLLITDNNYESVWTNVVKRAMPRAELFNALALAAGTSPTQGTGIQRMH
jgi:hypothetical protein